MNSPLATSTALPSRDERPLAELDFAEDLDDEERDLVIRRQRVQDELKVVRGQIDAEAAKADSDQTLIAQRTEAADGLLHVEQSLTEKIEPLKAQRHQLADEIRGLLADADVKIAEDVIDAGCTGLFARLSSIETVQKIRDNMGGSKVGLPCYVPPDRYCLIHRTIGGLQDGQTARHPSFITAISRELNDAERGYVKTIEHARRRQGQTRMADAQEALRNFSDDGVRQVNAEKAGVPVAAPGGQTPLQGVTSAFAPPDMVETFKCQEHGELSWGCRFCVAQAVVEGALEPVFVLVRSDEITRCTGNELVAHLETFDKQGIDDLQVLVRAATFRRKLARDD